MITGAVALLLAVWSALVPDDWTRFRGPNGAGVAEEYPLPAQFDRTTNLVWRAELPSGHSSPVLSNEHVFVTGSDAVELITTALDRRTGATAWRARIPRSRQLHVDKRNHPASPTPTTDGRNVYVFFQDFGLVSYDAQGRERWRHELGPFTNAYGMGSSPIVAGDLVVLVCDQSIGSFILAVDRQSGRERWKVERREATSGHSTPVLFAPPAGPQQLLVPGSFYLTAYELRTGRKLWWTSGLAFEMKATPVHDGTTVYISGTTASSYEDSHGRNIPPFGALRQADRDGDGRFSRDELPDALARRWHRLLDLDGDQHISEEEWNRYAAARRSAGGLWAFRMGGSGETTVESAVWHYDKAVPQLPSPVLYRGILYMVNDGGIVTALDPATGKVLAQRRLHEAVDSFYASPVAGDGKLFVVSESGKIVVLKAGVTLETLSINDLGEMTYATPALAGGRIFVRTREALYCFGRTSTPRQTR